MKKSFKFIDLFSGIGGFHQAMTNLGGKCVFASEIDPHCIEVYKKNYGIDSWHDITQVDAKDIPQHDVLCGGFPCQSFSKAGKQLGINEARGTLFFDIARILEYHHTKYIVLENVRNLVSHDNGNTWKTIQEILHNLGYRLTKKPLILSPHQFGVPQLRERVYILGKYEPENVDTPLEVKLPKLKTKGENSIYSILEEDVGSNLSEYENKVLTMWDDFYQGIKETVIGYPVWADYFTKKSDSSMPDWKKEFIKKNHNLYVNNKDFIDSWLKKYSNLKGIIPTHHKFEWQAGANINSVFEGLIQFRPSGVRVKVPDVFPALVAIVQTPIIGKYRRRISLRECARLQSFPDSFILDSDLHAAYKQFGNSVNVKVLSAISSALFLE